MQARREVFSELVYLAWAIGARLCPWCAALLLHSTFLVKHGCYQQHWLLIIVLIAAVPCCAVLCFALSLQLPQIDDLYGYGRGEPVDVSGAGSLGTTVRIRGMQCSVHHDWVMDGTALPVGLVCQDLHKMIAAE